MRFVHLTAEGRVELNYMWLPTWLGINNHITERVRKAVEPSVVGLPATEDNLDAIHQMVIDQLVIMLPNVIGLRDYLDGIKFVEL